MIDRLGLRLDGRVALVTGSSTGIGLAMARGLAQCGATVVINGRSAERLAAAAQALADAGLPVQQRAFDVADSAAVDRAIGDIEASIGPLHIVISNAGITRRAAVHELGDDDWRSVMATNADAAFYIGRAAARVMLPRKRGRIINVCSIMSEVARPGITAYAASKGAIKMLTKAMAVELAPHGITVNGIAPGYFRTELTQPLASDPQFDQWIVNRTPMRRWGQVDELASVAAFLAGDGASYITGHLLVVDGGITATL